MFASTLTFKFGLENKTYNAPGDVCLITTCNFDGIQELLAGMQKNSKN
jgi:hypothetical protein